MELSAAPDIQQYLPRLVKELEFDHIVAERIWCFRSYGATSRAYARIWSFPKIWQMALRLPPSYVIEVLAQHFDKLSYEEKIKVLIHELMHIPKNFSGALIPHRHRGRHINRRTVDSLYHQWQQNLKKQDTSI
jgi:predicted metallopeptidase